MTSRIAAEVPRAQVVRSGPWLVVRFPSVRAVASWAIAGGGLARASAVAWRQVSEQDLRPPLDAGRWLRTQLREAGLDGAVGLLTSRNVDSWVEARAEAGPVHAHCVATVGLSNALRAGDPPGPFARIGTINILCSVNAPLEDEALLEGLAIATEAKTVAIVEHRVASRRTGLTATGTGTDCVVIASPLGRRRTPYAGKHTEVGAAIGAAVRDAVDRGAREWSAQQEQA